LSKLNKDDDNRGATLIPETAVSGTQLSVTGLPDTGYLISPVSLQGAFIFPCYTISHQPWLSAETVKNYYSFSL
jgi:hypothetical protein